MEKGKTILPSEAPRLKPEEVRGRRAAGIRIVLVDLRDRESYEKKHIDGAISIPKTESKCLPEMISGHETWVFY